MKNRIFLLFLFPVFLIFFSCQDFFEKDISNSTVILVSPANNVSTNILTQTFTWEIVEGALKYRLQIVKPTFSSISQFLLDTNITSSRFQVTLQPGNYEWRVKAINGSSETEYFTNLLTIDTTSDLSGQIVLIQTPSDLSYSNNLVNSFAWSSIYNATSYNVQIASSDFSNSTNVIIDTSVSSTSSNFSVNQEGVFQIRVKAVNSRGSSSFSTPITFQVDTTKPNIPGLLLPANNASTNNPFQLHWDRGTVTGTPITDSVYIYSDSLVTLIERAGYTNSTNHSDSLGIGTYFWRVRSLDAAGNFSSYSTVKKFRIN